MFKKDKINSKKLKSELVIRLAVMDPTTDEYAKTLDAVKKLEEVIASEKKSAQELLKVIGGIAGTLASGGVVFGLMAIKAKSENNIGTYPDDRNLSNYMFDILKGK